MDPTFTPRRNAEVRSGGKIVRGRRSAAAKTPYGRPPPPQNPNWLTGVVFPATRMIASGAGKLISSVFGPDASSSSSSDNDSSSEDEVEDDNGDYYVTPGGNGGLVEKNGISPETNKRFKEPHSTFWKTETGGVVEQLLMQETFSREECERLMKIISSRVVDNSIIKEGPYGRLSDIPSGTIDTDIPDICSKAVMEAKKWLEEKKVGSSSKSDLEHGTCTFNSAELPQSMQVIEGEVGSPVDMAKSYMQVRPPWASPSLIHSDLKSPSSLGIELFKESTPYSAGGTAFSLSKKRDSLSTGSWNILEEIRRVRSKATEDMLRTRPSAKNDVSPFSLELETAQDSLVADKTEVGMCHEMHGPNSLTASRAINASQNLARGDGVDMTQDGVGNGALSSTPDITTSEKNQVLESIKIIEGEGGATYRPHHSTTVHTDSRSSDINCAGVKEVTESGATPIANGFPPSGSSFSARIETREIARASDDPNPDNPSHGKMSNSIPVEETCELLSEASVEIPVVYETNSIVSGSQNSSSMHDEDLSQQPKPIRSKRNLVGNKVVGGAMGKQEGRKLRGYSRKGRERGRGY